MLTGLVYSPLLAYRDIFESLGGTRREKSSSCGTDFIAEGMFGYSILLILENPEIS
jgi:hypothetical protein